MNCAVGDGYCVFVTFPFGILGQVWYLIVSIPDPCCLSFFWYGFLSFEFYFHWAIGELANTSNQISIYSCLKIRNAWVTLPNIITSVQSYIPTVYIK